MRWIVPTVFFLALGGISLYVYISAKNYFTAPPFDSTKIEYTADGTTWQALPGGDITDNELSWISVKLDAPILMKGFRFYVPDQSNSDFSDSWIRVVETEALELMDPSEVVAK